MKAKATLKYVRMSPRKMRIMANLVRGLPLNEAIAVLQHSHKKAGQLIRKVLVSAVANAEHQGFSDLDSLKVDTCSINNGPILKRWMSRAMGRANRIQHRTSHIEIVIAER